MESMKTTISHAPIAYVDAFIPKKITHQLEFEIEDNFIAKFGLLQDTVCDEIWYEVGDQLGIHI